MDEVKGYKHSDGRECTWVPSADVWMYWVEMQDRQICYRGHTEDKVTTREANVAVAAQANDRGEFGMPGIGMDWSVGLGQVWTLPPEPEHNWRAILTHTGLQCEFDGPDGVKGYTVDAVTDDARYIMEIVPEILGHFLHKNAQYARAQTGHDLGVKGIIPDINRKSAALITRFWDRSDAEPMEGEDPAEELMDDLIGHLLLMRARMRTA